MMDTFGTKTKKTKPSKMMDKTMGPSKKAHPFSEYEKVYR